jgi:cell wall-associated NlpC family hydrolase
LPDIAGAALRYVGAGYVFGGVPAHGVGQWDCSSFVNWVVGHDSSMAIPGYGAGAYNGQSHGPVVVDWATWSGASNVGGSPTRGDLCIWPGIGATGHIGIAVDATHMVSALNHIKGTVQTPIQGFGPLGVAVVFRSLTGNTGGSLTGCGKVIPGLSLAYALYHRGK